jgi:hypothetical protein
MMFVLLLVSIHAGSAQIDEEPLFLFRGARPLGLANAYEAIADDIYAIHYNPAGLAQIDEKIFQFLIVQGRATKDLLSETSTINEFIRDTVDPLTDSDDPLTDPNLKEERERLVERAENILAEELGLDTLAFLRLASLNRSLSVAIRRLSDSPYIPRRLQMSELLKRGCPGTMK